MNVPQKTLERLLAQWPRPTAPTYRFAKCWGCGRTLYFGMWHLFFRKEEREAHLCRQCWRKYAR